MNQSGFLAALCWSMVLALSETAAAQAEQAHADLGRGAWRGAARPTAHNEVFATADGCATCHSLGSRATALRTATGEDASPYGLWLGSVMANSFRDPYWRAQVQKEVAADPERGDEVQALCQRCHAPMSHHGRRIAGQEPTTVAAAAHDPLARDGVSCTVCHQIQPDGLGEETTFAGKARIQRGRRIFGPYAEPMGMPMMNMSGYQPTHATHLQSSALCATCHTLHTDHAGKRFPEQTPYLEWRNSVYQDENGRTDDSRSCQECHMAPLGDMRIARNPAGRDFNVPVRPQARSHAFVGGNAFLLDLLAQNREELGVPATVEALRQNAMASRRLLAQDTVRLGIGDLSRAEGSLRFAVRIENLTGHKFPTGYPSRRAWLHVQVRDGNAVLFDCGNHTTAGELAGVEDELRQAHHQVVSRPEQVVVYELVAHDEAGAPTTYLTRMATRGKDTRLLPRGWRADGPHAADTAPMGVGDDPDFVAGGDTVHFAVPLPAAAGRLTVVAFVRYQTIPPHWVTPLRSLEARECVDFVRMYDAADKAPELVAVAVRSEGG